MNQCNQKLDIQNPSEAGASLVEFVLLFPILIAVALAGIEFSRAMQVDQISGTFSREAASLAYRECASDKGAKLKACLDEVRLQFLDYADSVTTGADIIISVYVYEPADPGDPLASPPIPPTPAGFNELPQVSNNNCAGSDPKCLSQFQLVAGAITGNRFNIRTNTWVNQRTMVIAESFVGFRAMLPIVTEMFGFDPEIMYEVTII